MQARFLVLIAAAFSAGCLPTPGLEDIRLAASDSGKTVIMHVGQKAIVTLDSNPSTGYSWRLTQLDPTIVENTSQKYIAPSGQAIGAGGTEQWEFTARSVGATKLRLEYVGPGDSSGAAPTTIFEVILPVREVGDDQTPVADLQLDERTDGGLILLPVGGRAVLTLKSNATTGYQWQLVELDQAIAENTEHTYIPPSTDAVGAGGSERWVFTGRTAGQTALRLEYRRSWESPDIAPAAKFTATVAVYASN